MVATGMPNYPRGEVFPDYRGRRVMREEGLAGRDLPRLRVYCSDQNRVEVPFAYTDTGGIQLDLAVAGLEVVCDWYVIPAPEAIQRFGAATSALLTSEMIEVREVVDNDGTFETSGQEVTFSAGQLDGPSTQSIALRLPRR